MAAFIFSEAAGKWARYAMLPEANDALIWVLLQATGLEADAVLRDHDTLAAILAAANDEATFTGYARLTATGVTVTDDDANNAQDGDVADAVFNPTSVQSLGKILLCYDPDTTGGTDADIVPLFADDCVITTVNGIAFTYQVATGGFATAVAA